MQEKVKQFNDKRTCHKKPMPTYARILDIQSELGELAKEYLKSSKYGTQQFNLEEDFKEEYGDVLYALLSLANELGISSEECLDIALNKLQSRMEKKNSMGSGIWFSPIYFALNDCSEHTESGIESNQEC